MKTKRNLLTALTILGLLTNTMAQLPTYVPTNGIIAYYTFNGNADDESGNGNDGTVYGSTLTTDRFGNSNEAYSFNGTSNYIEVADDNALDVPNVTISAWYNAVDFGLPSQLEQGHIVSKREQSGWGTSFQIALISIGGDGIWATYTIGSNGWVDYNPLQPNVWTHVVYTHDDNFAKLYINGTLVNTVPISGGLSSNSLPMWIGARPNAGGNSSFYHGELDDIGLWNRALTEDEITSLYEGNDNGYNLVAYYPFNGNANDESGNGHHGTIFGTVTSTTDRFGSTDSAYFFDGQTGYISIPSLDSLAYTPITYCAWVIVNSYFPSPTPGHKFRTVVGRQTAYVLDCGAMGFYANGLVDGGAYDNNFTWWRGGGNTGDAPYSDSIPILNTWTHIAFAQDALGNWTWYTNGVLTNSGNFTDPQNYFDYFRIGGCNNSSEGNTFWNDKLDDISIWGRALTSTEIDSIYHADGWDIIIADFNASDTLGTTPLTVNFTDQSTGNPTSWQWDFGDENIDSIQNPTNIYQNAGSYTVTLIASDSVNSDTLTKVNYIIVNYPAPTADFEGTPLSGDVPLMVAFTDLSFDSVNTWLWEFGDSDTSTDQNPSHEYINPGDYSVTLTVSGPGGGDTLIKTNYITANYAEPTANFEGIPTSGNAPLEVTFTDLSVDSVDSWVWDFGDGGISYQQDPVYTYTGAGTYNVSLTVSGPGGSDVIEKIDYISVFVDAPIADFVGAPTTGEAPLLVNFTDLSTGSIDTWSWNFGDSGSSSDQNPSHEYLTPGNFTVSLTVSGTGGATTEVKTDYVLIPVGVEEYETQFILVYPNPVTNNLNIVFPDAKSRILTFNNITGKFMLEYQTNKKEEIINMQQFPMGVYPLTIKDGSISNVIKIIKR